LSDAGALRCLRRVAGQGGCSVTSLYYCYCLLPVITVLTDIVIWYCRYPMVRPVFASRF